jgi:hypothetical protein
MPERVILLRRDARAFEQHGTASLRSTDTWVKQGSQLRVSAPQRMYYDAREQPAISFNVEGRTLWLLVENLGLPELMN